MVLPSKTIPPPPKQPGTHTNAEVKEALHARALRRTILITAVVILLLAALAVVSSIAQEYEGKDETVHTPKAIVIVAEGLTPDTWYHSIRSNKSPFTRLLNNSGGLFTNISTAFPADTEATPQQRNVTNLIRLLTGSSAANVKPTLNGYTSILRTVRSKFKPIIVAPASYWSSNQMDNVDTACDRVGFFDAECTGTSCSTVNKEAYCNAFRKLVTCDSESELYADNIIAAFKSALEVDGDLLYVQLTSFVGEEAWNATVGSTLQKRSEMNLVDGTVGRIAMALAERTKAKRENWMIVVTSEGANAEEKAPLLMVVYSDGQVVQLRRPTAAQPAMMATDIHTTLRKWFGVETGSLDESRVIGLCTDGTKVANCPNVTSTA